MTKLETLLQQLCPDGVEHRQLKEAAELKRGTSLTKKTAAPGEFPVISGGKEPAFYCDKYNRIGETITVAGSGAGAGFLQYWNKPIFVSDAFSINGIDNLTDTKYLFYALQNRQEDIYATKKGGGVPHVHISDIDKFKIPIPPLPVQKEIVKILDKFLEVTSALTNQLTAELEVWEKQCEYYNNALLKFNSNAKWEELGNIAEITDYVANGSFASLKANVVYKREPDYAVLIRTTDYSSGFDLEKMIYIDEHAYSFLSKSKLFGGEIIINNIGAGVGTTFRCPCLNTPMSLAPNAIVIKTNSNAFYYYWLKSKWGQAAIKKITGTGSIPKFNKTGLRSIKVPVPPLAEQERIVSILDRFNTQYHELTFGLSAEIEARRKQYEYYRDKLLTFKEAQ